MHSHPNLCVVQVNMRFPLKSKKKNTAIDYIYFLKSQSFSSSQTFLPHFSICLYDVPLLARCPRTPTPLCPCICLHSPSGLSNRLQSKLDNNVEILQLQK